MNARQEILEDYSPRTFIEQSQADAAQVSYDVTAAISNASAHYACTETRAHVVDNYGELKAAQMRLNDMMGHMETTMKVRTN